MVRSLQMWWLALLFGESRTHASWVPCQSHNLTRLGGPLKIWIHKPPSIIKELLELCTCVCWQQRVQYHGRDVLHLDSSDGTLLDALACAYACSTTFITH
jgi:hypothetical protein